MGAMGRISHTLVDHQVLKRSHRCAAALGPTQDRCLAPAAVFRFRQDIRVSSLHLPEVMRATEGVGWACATMGW